MALKQRSLKETWGFFVGRVESSDAIEKMMMNNTMTKAEKKAAYDAWYLAEIDKGLEDIEAGRVLSNEEAEDQMRLHMTKLHEKYGQRAA